MRVVEVSGKTVDEAVDRALAQIGLSLGQVDVDVIREAKKGLLGFGAEEAIVRVAAKEGVSTVPTGRPRRGRGGGGGGARPQGDGAGTRERPQQPQQEQRPQRSQGPPRDGDGDTGGGERRPRSEGRSRGERGGRGRGGRGRGGDGDRARRDEPRAEPVEAAEPMLVPGVPPDPPAAPPEGIDDPVDFAGRSLRDILTLLGLAETTIQGREPQTPGDGEGLNEQVFDIFGDDDETSDELGALIGRRGETLSALQYLLNVMVSTRYDGEHLFGIDVEEYRHRREQSLLDMAERVAEEVRETGDVITLEPMPAAERRILHLALKEEEGVVTESVGDGARRQVEVLPVAMAEDGGAEDGG